MWIEIHINHAFPLLLNYNKLMFKFKTCYKANRNNWKHYINIFVLEPKNLTHILIDNTSIFKAEIEEWQRDQEKKNKAQKNYRRLTTDELINKLDNTSILRCIWYGIDTIDIKILTKNCKTDKESREKIITFYQNVLDQSLAIFNKNLDPKNYVKVIKSIIDFNQKKPNLNAYFSNWNLKFSKLLNEEIRGSNIDKNDLVKILYREAKSLYYEKGIDIKINELYLEKMNKGL